MIMDRKLCKMDTSEIKKMNDALKPSNWYFG